MKIHATSSYVIYFGDAADQLSPAHYLHMGNPETFLGTKECTHLRETLAPKSIMFLHQTHSALGSIIEEQCSHVPFQQEGDFLITKSAIALGVMTADCLPIVLYDARQHVIAIAHAGWRGSVLEIGRVTIATMMRHFQTAAEDLQVLFGPCARVCCYQVQEDFSKNMSAVSWGAEYMHKRDGAWYFDLPGFNRRQLEEVGVASDRIDLSYAECTVCTPNFYSYRRQGEAAGRQMTVVMLK